MGTKGELFRIWYALNDKHMDPSVFVLSHLVETTKINYNNVIGVGGIITAIAKGIGFGGKVRHFGGTLYRGDIRVSHLSAHENQFDKR